MMEYTMAQMDPTTGDIEGNKQEIMATLEAADSDVVVFPEMALPGYCVGDRVENDQFLAENLEALDAIAAATDETAAVVGFLDGEGDERYNAAAVLQDGEVKGTVHKRLLPNYRYFDDERYFEAGDEPGVVSLKVDGEELELGVSICEDMWDGAYDAAPIADLADAGADVVVNINASPFEPGKRDDRDRVIRDHVEATGLPFLYVNTVGAADVGKNVLAFDGESRAYDADGALVAAADRFEEDTVTVAPADADGIELDDERWEEAVFDALTMALEDYADKTGFDTVVEPVSGGIDSSLGLAICAEAFGPDNVVAYNMPSEVNAEATKSDAEALAANLDVEYRVLPVEDAYQEVIGTYEEHVDDIHDGVARENVYARLRGLFAMLETNEEDGTMLVSNGNQTEMALGYATLYGDMTGGLSILGDLSKTEVYDLARYVNERHGEEVIPDSVFERQPSAELREGQEDPFEYDVVAPLVDDILENRRGPGALAAAFEEGELGDPYPDDVYDRYDADGFRELVEETYGSFQRASFKRAQAPPVIAVTGRSFGTDFREPIIDGWQAGGDA